MGKCNLGKESAKKAKENDRNQSKICSGNFNEQTTYTNKTEKWTGKDGYKWTQGGKIMATVHPKLAHFKNEWTCKKCINNKDVTVIFLDAYWGGGEGGRFQQKWKATCKCGWKAEKDENEWLTSDPLKLN